MEHLAQRGLPDGRRPRARPHGGHLSPRKSVGSSSLRVSPLGLLIPVNSAIHSSSSSSSSAAAPSSSSSSSSSSSAQTKPKNVETIQKQTNQTEGEDGGDDADDDDDDEGNAQIVQKKGEGRGGRAKGEAGEMTGGGALTAPYHDKLATVYEYLQSGGNLLRFFCPLSSPPSSFVGGVEEPEEQTGREDPVVVDLERMSVQRDEMVVAASLPFAVVGRSLESLERAEEHVRQAVAQLLCKLKTPFVDLLFIELGWVEHIVKKVEEGANRQRQSSLAITALMKALDQVVQSGSARNIGVTEWPSWIVAQANTIAELNGWSLFVAYEQVNERISEEVTSMCEHFNIGIIQHHSNNIAKHTTQLTSILVNDANPYLQEQRITASSPVPPLTISNACEKREDEEEEAEREEAKHYERDRKTKAGTKLPRTPRKTGGLSKQIARIRAQQQSRVLPIEASTLEEELFKMLVFHQKALSRYVRFVLSPEHSYEDIFQKTTQLVSELLHLEDESMSGFCCIQEWNPHTKELITRAESNRTSISPSSSPSSSSRLSSTLSSLYLLQRRYSLPEQTIIDRLNPRNSRFYASSSSLPSPQPKTNNKRNKNVSRRTCFFDFTKKKRNANDPNKNSNTIPLSSFWKRIYDSVRERYHNEVSYGFAFLLGRANTPTRTTSASENEAEKGKGFDYSPRGEHPKFCGENEAFGVLHVFYNSLHRFGPSEKSLVSCIADLLTQAIQQKKMNAALWESNRRFQVMADTAPVLLWMSGEDGLTNFFNKRWLEFTGRTMEEEVGRGWTEGVHPDDYPYCMDVLLSHFNARKPFQMEYRLRHHSGEYRWIYDIGTPRFGHKGEFQGFIGSCVDITERKHAEALALEAKQFETASKAKSLFVSFLSHETRNPLNAVIGSNQLLLETNLSREQRLYAKNIETATELLLDLISDVLDLSKIEANKVELEDIEFDLRDVVETAVELMTFGVPPVVLGRKPGRQKTNVASHPKVEIASFISPNVPFLLRGDPTRIRQIIINFLSNARKFTSDGYVLLSVTLLEESSSSAKLRVNCQDTGIGVLPEDEHLLFRLFSQVEGATTRRKFGGTGLGLYLSKQLVKLMGGRIGFESSAGKGANFWFEVELTKASSAPSLSAPALPSSALSYPLSSSPSTISSSSISSSSSALSEAENEEDKEEKNEGRKWRVLVVESLDVVRRVCQDYLNSVPDIECFSAHPSQVRETGLSSFFLSTNNINEEKEQNSRGTMIDVCLLRSDCFDVAAQVKQTDPKLYEEICWVGLAHELELHQLFPPHSPSPQTETAFSTLERRENLYSCCVSFVVKPVKMQPLIETVRGAAIMHQLRKKKLQHEIDMAESELASSTIELEDEAEHRPDEEEEEEEEHIERKVDAKTILLVEDNSLNQRVLCRIIEKAGHSCEIAGDGVEALVAVEKKEYDLIFMDLLMPTMDGFTAAVKIRERERKYKPAGCRVPIIALTGNVLLEDMNKCLQCGMDGFLTKKELLVSVRYAHTNIAGEAELLPSLDLSRIGGSIANVNSHNGTERTL
ncbi:PAS domain S-box protein [Balamuthia mandrillaris]